MSDQSTRRPGQGITGSNTSAVTGFSQSSGTRAAPKSPEEAIQPTDAPPPPKRSRQAKNNFVVFMNFVMTCLVMTTIVAAMSFYFGKQWFDEPGPLQVAQTVQIREGASLADISAQLQARGIISSEFVFSRGVQAYRAASSMKAGEYAFKPGMSMREVMETIRSGKGIVHKVSVPEGLTTFQIYQRIANNKILVGDMPEMLPEGSLMPDTYPFQRGTTRAEIVNQMKLAQDKFLREIWERRVQGLPITTPEEMVVLASIVEKETGRADERSRVASVFINRLNKGMRLQSDPTIIYGLFGGQGKPKDRPIYKSDIEAKNDFNTYVIDGLPPTPIANPGRAALEAVANPSITEDLFFVADGTGGHVFAKTLDQHRQNVKRWRAIEKRLKEEAAKRAKAAEDEAQSN